MSKKPKLTEEDRKVFANAMRGVKRIAQKKIAESPSPPPIRRIQPTSGFTPEDTAFHFSNFDKLPLINSEDFLCYARSGISDKTLRKFKKGQHPIEAHLDLHGMTVAQAREALEFFLTKCQSQDYRFLLIIHGKGRNNQKPILKNKLNHWLRQTEEVLAFCSASQKDGGTGALYIVLRRSKKHL